MKTNTLNSNNYEPQANHLLHNYNARNNNARFSRHNTFNVMEKLELKHLAAYLPYGVWFKSSDGLQELKSICLGLKMVNFGWGNAKEFTEIKLILRPLSDLTKEIEVNGERFVPAAKMITHGFHNSFWYDLDKFDYRYLYAMDLEKLLEWHFDIYSLIEKGLAIDKNTL